MSTADDKRLQDQVNAANNPGATCSVCHQCHVDHEGDRLLIEWQKGEIARLNWESDPFEPIENGGIGNRWAYFVSDGPKMLRETLCVAQNRIRTVDDPRNGEHAARLGRLIDETERHRPLGPDCKHGNRHTPTCGCEDKPAADLDHRQADDTPPDTHSEECVQHRTHGFAACTCTPPDTRSEVEEPIEGGWYAYSGGAQAMVFHLRDTGQWSVHLDNGSAADCAWGYIEQALGVWDLVPLVSPAQHDAQVAAKALREAADEIAIGPDYKDRRSHQAKRLRDRADRIEGTR